MGAGGMNDHACTAISRAPRSFASSTAQPSATCEVSDPSRPTTMLPLTRASVRAVGAK